MLLEVAFFDFFRDLDLEGLRRAGPLTSRKPFVCLKMFLLTLLIFLRDLLRPRELATEAQPDFFENLEADRADFETERRRLTEALLFDFERRPMRLDALLLRFLTDFFLQELLLLRDDPLPPLHELLLTHLESFFADLFFDPLKLLRRPLSDAGALLLADRSRRISCISPIISFIRRFLRFDSVASIISVAIISRLLENSKTRLLNWEGSPRL